MKILALTTSVRRKKRKVAKTPSGHWAFFKKRGAPKHLLRLGRKKIINK